MTSLIVAAGALMSPWLAPATAGTYAWQLPTGSAPGSSNPDHDSYGTAPWTYVETTAFPPSSSTSPQLLPTFSDTIDGGLTGWYDGTDGDQPFVAANRSRAQVGVVPAGQLALQPARDRLVGIGWTSPLSSSQTMAINGRFVPEDTTDAPCASSQPTWMLEHDGNVIASGGGPSPAGGPQQSFSQTAIVSPGDTIYLLVSFSSVFDAPCDTAGISLDISASASPPAVTLTSPSAGATVLGAQPTFKGTSATGFGAAREVTVRIWRGSSRSGTPLESLSAVGSSGKYTSAPNPPLANGRYTAQAEQDDLAGDAGFSKPVAFTVRNVLRPPEVIAGSPTLYGSDQAAIPVTCTAAAGSCTGQVLVLTVKTTRPMADGPSGHVRVLFGYVQLRANATATIRRAVPGYVAAALRRAAPVRVEITVKLRDSAGHAIDASGVKTLALSSTVHPAITGARS